MVALSLIFILAGLSIAHNALYAHKIPPRPVFEK